MDEVIGRLGANISVDRTATEKAVGTNARFLAAPHRATTTRAFMRRSAGAGQAINAAQTVSHSGVVLGARDGVLPARMTAFVTRTLIGNVCEQAGKNAAGVTAGAAPRLSHSV